ncbi:MAG: universal stress protein [Bacteroidales bacterium]|nr:universal stress protein [Bacteroidales bacterium]
MKDIIVGIDFSQCAINALEHAINIANHSKSNVLLLFVHNTQKAHKTIYKYTDAMDEATKLLEELIVKYQPQLIKTKITFKIREGRVYNEIVNEAKERKAYLIIIGTHGASGFEEMWIGSNAYRIISASTTPVITIREGIKIDRDLKRIILPIDSTLSSRQKVPHAMTLAKLYKAEIHVIALFHTKVKDVQDMIIQYSQQACDYFEKNQINFVLKSIATKNATETTIEYAREIDANLIVIMTEQVSTPANFFLGPLAQQMIHQSPFPVMSIQPKELLRVLSR